MSRERAPKPGATWEREVRPVEVVIPDVPPPALAPNRAARRAAARTNRRKGNR